MNVDGVKLPSGYNRSHIPLYIEIPEDYPATPPGVGGHHVYVPRDLTFWGYKLKDMHLNRSPEEDTSGLGPWAWWCYESITWNPLRDNLFSFVEMFRSDLGNPAPENEPTPPSTGRPARPCGFQHYSIKIKRIGLDAALIRYIINDISLPISLYRLYPSPTRRSLDDRKRTSFGSVA